MSNKNYCVYIHISPSNKRYIGITCQEPSKRWKKDGNGYKQQPYFYNAIEKYGWDNFQHIIIAKGLTEDEAKWLEIELIKVWDTTNKDKGYNVSLGGEGTNGWIPSEETRKKISKARKGKKLSEETKKKISENHADMSGENNPNYGNGDKIKGKNNPNATKVICITTMKIFDTIKQASEFYGVAHSSISLCCKKERKHCGKLEDGTKLQWKYYSEYLEQLENNNNNNN